MSAIPVRHLPALTPATVLEALRAQREGIALGLGKDAPDVPRTAPKDAFDALLLPGSVVELSSLPGAGALTLGLMLLAEAHRRARSEGRASYLCALDPSRTLHAPAVASLLGPRGVGLSELVVLQPDREKLLRTAVRAKRSGAFAGVLVDAGAVDDVSGDGFVHGVRRLALAAEDQGGFAVLLTSRKARRGLPLPVAARALVEGAPEGLDAGAIRVSFLRHKFGNLPRLVVHDAVGGLSA